MKKNILNFKLLRRENRKTKEEDYYLLYKFLDNCIKVSAMRRLICAPRFVLLVVSFSFPPPKLINPNSIIGYMCIRFQKKFPISLSHSISISISLSLYLARFFLCLRVMRRTRQ